MVKCHKCKKEIDLEREIYYEYWEPSHASPNPFYYCAKCRNEDLEELLTGEKDMEQLLVYTNAKEIIVKDMEKEMKSLLNLKNKML